MMYTPFGNMTDEELLRHGLNMKQVPTALEMELLTRLEARLNEEQTGHVLEPYCLCRRVPATTT